MSDKDMGLDDNDLDYCCCDTCGGFETMWDDTQNKLWCYSCNDYKTSIDIDYESMGDDETKMPKLIKPF